MNYWFGTEKVTLRNWGSHWMIMICWFVIEAGQTVGNLATHFISASKSFKWIAVGYLHKVLISPNSFSKFATFDIMRHKRETYLFRLKL